MTVESEQLTKNRDEVFKNMMYELETKGYYINDGQATGNTIILNGLKYNNEISKYTAEYERQCQAFFNEQNNNVDPATAFHNILEKIYDWKAAEILREGQQPKWLHTLSIIEIQDLIDDHLLTLSDPWRRTEK
jgi:hypothetical protein